MYELRSRVVFETSDNLLATTTIKDYKQRYSKEALRALIKSRGGSLPARKTKPAFARTLVAMDKNKPNLREAFRFSDLPPELRNAVYEELLTLPEGLIDGGPGAFPAILATNKETYHEAVGILYGVNTGRVGIRSSNTNRSLGRIQRSSRTVYLETNHYVRRIPEFEDMQPGLSNMLGRFRTLSITLELPFLPTFNRWLTRTVASMANQALFLLVSCLGSNRALKSVEFVCRDWPHLRSDFPDATLQNMLWPLTQLPQLEKLSLDGMPLRIGFDIELNKVTGIRDEDVMATIWERANKIAKLRRRMVPDHSAKDECKQALWRAATVLERITFVDANDVKELVDSSRELAEILEKYAPEDA
ncbi:hypothetical protein BST61_g10871 [Cercospora zeina]